jgi:RNA polymerase sigma-70 factor (sigma-E family)
LFVGDRGHAEDLAQTALLRTYLHFGRLRSPAAADAYTRKTMARLAGRWSRRRWRGELPSGDLFGRDTTDPLAGSAAALDLYAALGGLPWPQRAVLVLRYFEGLTVIETAEVLSCSAGTVKSRASRALTKLRDELGSRLIGDDEPKEVPHG